MNRISDIAGFPASLRGGVVAIGNFDGVHRGHRHVLERALSISRTSATSAIVLTFEPHPRTWFKPDNPVFRLTPADLKAELLAEAGFDAVIEQSFDQGFSGLSAEEFVSEILMRKLGVSHVVTGYDFHFGKGRAGTPAYLSEMGKTLGFETTLVEVFTDSDGETISSSRIRKCLSTGDIKTANHLLGYTYRVRGTVIKGQQIGRTLGFPTANLELPAEARLAHGIYVARITLEDGTAHGGVASYGRRPTFDNGRELLEPFLFDFSGDLYGRTITVELLERLRGEEKFADVEALTEQMKKDAKQARACLKALSA